MQKLKQGVFALKRKNSNLKIILTTSKNLQKENSIHPTLPVPSGDHILNR